MAAIRRMPPEDGLSAKAWKGRTIFATGRSRFTPTRDLFPEGVPPEQHPHASDRPDKGFSEVCTILLSEPPGPTATMPQTSNPCTCTWNKPCLYPNPGAMWGLLSGSIGANGTEAVAGGEQGERGTRMRMSSRQA